MDFFMEATRKAWRFPSVRGDLTVEQLWQLPLSSKGGFDLDTVAKSINAQVRQAQEESFVTANKSAGQQEATNKLEVVKAVIAAKLADNAETLKRQHRATERRRLLDALAAKEDQELTAASKDDLLRRLAELDA